MRKSVVLLAIIILFSGITGCAYTRGTTATAANVTCPVLVGPVMTIKGQPQTEDSGMVRQEEFDVRVNKLDLLIVAPIQGGRTSKHTLGENSNKLDAELLKMKENNPQDMILVDKLYFGSYIGGSLVGYALKKEWAGIKGALYNSSQNSE
jgi:hypothetical protein